MTTPRSCASSAREAYVLPLPVARRTSSRNNSTAASPRCWCSSGIIAGTSGNRLALGFRAVTMRGPEMAAGCAAGRFCSVMASAMAGAAGPGFGFFALTILMGIAGEIFRFGGRFRRYSVRTMVMGSSGNDYVLRVGIVRTPHSRQENWRRSLTRSTESVARGASRVHTAIRQAKPTGRLRFRPAPTASIRPIISIASALDHRRQPHPRVALL